MTQDNCTCWPDAAFGVDYSDCCAAHDRHYDIGGNAEDRKQQDIRLCDCVYSKFHRAGKRRTGWVWSNLMYIGVRLFASRWFCGYIYPRTKQRFNWID